MLEIFMHELHDHITLNSYANLNPLKDSLGKKFILNGER